VIVTSSRAPLILITPCRRLQDYEASVRAAGGAVLVADLADTARALSDVDGVLLTGGGDLDPSRYGEAPHPTYDAAEPGRDAFELALTAAVLASGTPMLAICRGLQVLNVACAGTLIQDIPDQRPQSLPHDVRPANAVAHTVAITPGTHLASSLPEATRRDSLRVNSRHHQAVGRLGADLVVSAIAPDGIVEAIEHRTHPYCVGVQWHPENFVGTGEFQPLFAQFVAACRGQRRVTP
jgi:putative glutamine amidotransferase